MDDDERHDWASNDEGLHDLMTAFARKGEDDDEVEQLEMDWVRQNRDLIDRVAGNVVGGSQPAHYLKYGG